MNKLSELDSLIMEVLNDEPELLNEKLPFNKDDFERLFGTAITPRGLESGQKRCQQMIFGTYHNKVKIPQSSTLMTSSGIDKTPQMKSSMCRFEET